MPEYAPFRYRCDGEGCDRTIGDVGAFLWNHEGNLCFCSNCWEKRQAGKHKCPKCGERTNLESGGKGIIRDENMMMCNRCGYGEHKDKFKVN